MEVKQEKVQSFFDGLAAAWDSNREVKAEILRDIIDCADIVPGCRVLDVACGTGVLFPFYLERDAAHVTGIDLSPEMIRIAAQKYQDDRLTLVAADVEQAGLGFYDRIVILNALPHFPDPERLIGFLAAQLVPGGRLTIAHDRPREAINGHHRQTASEVSRGLPPADKTAAMAARHLMVDVILDDEVKYIVSGINEQNKENLK